MNRRDFLLFRTAGGRRIVELSCERLYMRCVDAQAPGTDLDDDAWDGWDGEPPRVVREPTVDEIFRDLEQEIEGADVVRLVDTGWLASDDLKRRLETTLDRFRARGGQVEA